MNFGKLAMLHRLSDCKPISIYDSDSSDDVKKLYDYLQSLCNDSRELTLRKNSILCVNPFLAYHLEEEIRKQTIVPQGRGGFPAEPETLKFINDLKKTPGRRCESRSFPVFLVMPC